MTSQNSNKIYMAVVIIAGLISMLGALVYMPVERLDIYVLMLACIAIAVGSRVTVQIPSFKSHIAVSDTFIFLALLTIGGEFAIILAGFEAFFSSWRFCNKKVTVFFNAAAMALSTAIVVFVLKVSGLYAASQLHGYGPNAQNFIIALSVIALTQFIVNTALCSFYDSLKSDVALWETWKSKYIWTFLTYFVGAANAGVLVRLSGTFGFRVVLLTIPVIFLLFLTYRMYLKNVEISMRQAEQANEYAKVLEKQSGALRESEQRFRSAFSYAPIGIALVSQEGKWLKVNHALSDILGYTAEEFLATDFQAIIFPEDLGVSLVKIHEVRSGKIANWQMEQRYLHKSGRTVWTSWSVSSADNDRSDSLILIFQIQDITDKKLFEEKLQHEATHDALTGLPNRSYFMTRLASALQKAKINPKYRVSVLFIDLDRFKNVNDSLGHFVGDQLLIAIADRLRECMRPPDIVARLGGDEFTILVEGRNYQEEVTSIAERIQNKFNTPFNISGHEVYSSASIGILLASERHRTSEDMMRDADTAMYHAKRAGKARHEVFDENMHFAVKQTLQLETDLRKAVDNEEISVFYQPVFSLATGKIKGVEALMRWSHPDRGEISPDKFIPLAEEIGLIDTLGESILRKACLQMGSVYEALSSRSRLTLSVNLSCKQFGQPTLVQNIKNILKETGFRPNRLKLEITESVFFEYQEKAIQMLHDLRDLGIELDIDDFGTGYSNLSYLVRLPISTLKIDRSFISPISDDGTNTEIVKTILDLAGNLGLKTIAEGIETTTQLNTLKKLKCEYGQGFLLAKPMNFEDVREFMFDEENMSIPKAYIEDVSIVSTLQ
ncbi:MAG: EAL domain-containing protein [Pyrinomonadaceae bacterium]